jgi:hypothetical protein
MCPPRLPLAFHQKRWFRVALFFIYVTVCRRNMISPKETKSYNSMVRSLEVIVLQKKIENFHRGSLVCKASATSELSVGFQSLHHPRTPLLVWGSPILPRSIQGEIVSGGPHDIHPYSVLSKKVILCDIILFLVRICHRNMTKNKMRTCWYKNLDGGLEVEVLHCK